jgi:drug/metabolite transporter (DMT)-like permease
MSSYIEHWSISPQHAGLIVPMRSKVGRIFLALLGVVFLLLGIVGLVLPIIPGLLLLLAGAFLLAKILKKSAAQSVQE